MQEGNQLTASESVKMSSETMFELKKSGVSSTCVSVSVDFSPLNQQVNLDSPMPAQSPVLRSIPIYNTDDNYFTPSFILEADKAKYLKNQNIYKQLFEQKVQQIDQELTQIYLPRPSRNNSFCSVCKMIFDDYLTHVNLPIHKTFMEKSEFYSDIKTICGKFVHLTQQISRKKTSKRQLKTKTVKKQPKSPKKSRKIHIDSTSATRFHSTNELLVDEVN